MDQSISDVQARLDECVKELMKLPEPPRNKGDGPQERVDYILEILEDVRSWIADPFKYVILTDREREVITLLSHGVPTREIAKRTGTRRQPVHEAIRRAIRKIEKAHGCELEFGDLVEYTFSLVERILS